MQTPKHSNTRCPIYLHPAAAHPAAVERIQQRTGLLVIINQGRAIITPNPALAVSVDLGSWGGDAA